MTETPVVAAPRRGPHWSRALVFALLFTAAWFWRPRAPEAPPPPPQFAARADAQPAPKPGTGALPADAATGPREAQFAPVDADLSLPYEFTLDLAVVDRYGLPLPDANVFAAPPACGFCRLPEPTDARGHATFACRARLPKLPLWLAVLARGVAESLRQVELTAGETTALQVVARAEEQDTTELERLLEQGASAQDLRRMLDQQRRYQERESNGPRRGRLERRDRLDILCGRSLLLFSALDCNACHLPSETAAYAALQWATDLLPRTGSVSIFADLRLQAPGSQELERRRREAQVPASDEWERRLDRQYGRGRTGFVHGTVRSADDKPVAFAPVAWLQDGALRMRTTADASGNYQLRLPVGVNCTLQCRTGDRGQGSVTVVAAPGAHARYDLRLEPALLLRGRAQDERGDPLVKWRVEFDEGARATGVAITEKDGAFVFADLERPGRMLLWPADADLRLPVLQSDLALPDGPAVDLRLQARTPTRGHLRVRAVLPAGHEHVRVELRVLQMDTGRGAHLVHTGVDNGFELEGLPAGPYRGELGAPGLGWMTFGPVWLDGRGLWDLGAFALPRPGRARLLLDADAPSPLDGAHTLWRRDDAVDVAVWPGRPAPDLIELPPGDYVLAWPHGGDIRAAPFRVESADEVQLDLRR